MINLEFFSQRACLAAVLAFPPAFLALPGLLQGGGEAEALRLHDPLPDHADVLFADGFRFTSDGEHVVFSADPAEDTRHEIFAVPLTGGELVRLNGELGDDGFVLWKGVRLSPDNDTVVYIADMGEDEEKEEEEILELFATSIRQPEPVKLSPPLEETGGVLAGGLQFTPDGSRVVFRARTSEEEPVRLYSVTPSGGDLVVLSEGLPAGSHVSSHGLSVTPDGSTVVFLANEGGQRAWRLFAASTTGGNLRELNDPLPPGGSVDPLGIMIAPDGHTVIHRLVGDSVTLHAAALHGDGGRMLSGGNVLAPGLQFVGDSGLLFLHAGPDGARSIRLVDFAAGGQPTVVARPSEEWALATVSIRVVGEEGLVVYTEERFEEPEDEDEDPIRLRRLVAAPLAGGSPRILTDELTSLRGYLPIPGAGRLAVVGNLHDEEKEELFSVSLTGGDTFRLSQELEEDEEGHVLSSMSTSDGATLIYLAVTDDTGLHQLYSVPSSGGDVTRLNGDLPDRAEVYDARLSPCEEWVVYTADQDERGIIELYRVRLSAPPGEAVAVRIHNP